VQVPPVVVATPTPVITSPGIELDLAYHPGLVDDTLVSRATRRVNSHGGQLTRQEMEAVLAEAGWSGAALEEALAVAWCESRWSPQAQHGEIYGLFQLWSGWFPWAGEDLERWMEPVTNARVALHLYQRDGWKQWQCKPAMTIP
jgi:hypothetical protein